MIKELIRRLVNLYRLSSIDIDSTSIDLSSISKIYIETLDITDKDSDTLLDTDLQTNEFLKKEYEVSSMSRS